MSENNPARAAFEFHDKLKELIIDFEKKSGTSVKAILVSREDDQSPEDLQLQISYG